MKYKLEDILKIFQDHAAEVESKIDDERINPDFNLPAAFVCMIEEIMMLKRKTPKQSQ